MKTITTNQLTRTYLQKLDKQNYLATTTVVLIITLSLFWLLFQIGGASATLFFSDSMYAIASIIGAGWASMTAYRARYGPLRLAPRHQLAWLLVTIGLFVDSLGGAYFTYLEQLGHLNPVPSYADLGFTLFYPFAFAGLLLMPKEAASQKFRVRTALDALITTLCLLGISWFFFISTVFTAQRDAQGATVASIATAVAYPFWDMLLILAIVLLISRRPESVLRSSLLMCGTGILALIWADTGYAYFTALNTYQTGTAYIDTFWFVSFFLIGLSSLYQYKALVSRAYNEHTHPMQIALRPEAGGLRRSETSSRSPMLLQSALIYFPLTIILVLMVYSEYAEGTVHTGRTFFLVVLTAIVGILVAVRYLFTTRENELLLQEREQKGQEAERLRVLSTELTNILELDRLLERIGQIATSELGFDAALLMLMDAYDLPFAAQSRLQIRVTPAASSEVNFWRVQGTQFAAYTTFIKDETDVLWAKQAVALPKELEAWRQEQNIRTTLFIPLIYKEKILGSLGFASRSEQPFSQHDTLLAKTYTEQVAAIIEHARLYQTTYEQEIFAKAMANIAARLNAAVVEPTEIYQLICDEAANALRADYAFLYGASNTGQLVPLASFVSEHEAPAILNDWPPIHQHEYEAQALTGLQPVLMQLHAQYPLPTTNKLLAISHTVRQKSSGMLPAIMPVREREIDGYPTSLLREKLARRFVHTAVLSPLIAGGDPLGLLILARSLLPGIYDKTPFTMSDMPYVQDFTEQAAVALTNAQLYQRLRTAHEQLQELDQLKDQFMVTASHELRTPLTAVQGYIELIAQYDEMLPPEQRKEFLHKAQRSCDELVVLLQNVMDASQLEIEGGVRPGHIERVRLQEMIDSVITLVEPHLTQEQREVHLAIPAQLTVEADAGRLRQVLVNISVNALKYSPPATPIAFSAYATFHSHRSVIIKVTDKGKGIPVQKQAHLFKRFVRLESDINSPVRGSGLGLYISRRLIEAMNGKIWIESSGIPGEGSTFCIQLPMVH